MLTNSVEDWMSKNKKAQLRNVRMAMILAKNPIIYSEAKTATTLCVHLFDKQHNIITSNYMIFHGSSWGISLTG